MPYLATPFRALLTLLLVSAGLGQAQLSTSAYRVLGQPDLRQNGINRVQGLELLSPFGVALDASRSEQVRIYISDTFNYRVLAWRDARSYQNGEAPALVLGQPGPQYSQPNGIGSRGFNAPLGLAVDPRTGNLYVADFGNNRILRFPDPFSNPSRVEPDYVYGQPNFTTTSSGIGRSALNGPRSVAFDSAGNLWVADSVNHRVLRFNSGVLDSPTPPEADTVIGQPDFFSGGANRSTGAVSASGLDTPIGLAFDPQDNLYVADFNNNRVLRFSAPLGPNVQGPAASAVIGQPDFTTRLLPVQVSNTTVAGPSGIFVDSSRNLYVAAAAHNRVLVFSLNQPASGAHTVFGQTDFTGTVANVGVFPRASASTLFAPRDVKTDSSGNVYIVDTSNNRSLAYPPGSKSATKVWGQSDFSSNGPNQVKPGSTNAPSKVAIDYSQSPQSLYVSDTSNHRILGWKDAVRFRNGDPADIVIGQPDLRTGIPNVDTRASQTPTAATLSSPVGIAVEPATGALFVADSGNNRVLRFPRPVSQAGRVTADAVVGQVDFNSSVSALVTASSLRAPRDIAFSADGNLFIADTGNNRVVEYDSIAMPAIRVYGQPNFTSAVSSPQVSAQTLTAPRGVFVDSAFNLYVADTGANRVLIFPDTQSAPSAGLAAAYVIGQTRFDSTGGGAATTLNAPSSVRVGLNANIFVADTGNNRVLQFPPFVFLPIAGGAATSVVGQSGLGGNSANWNSPDGLATPEGLSGPAGIFLDRQDTLYVADSGNNRVVHFLKPAAVVNAATFQASVPVARGGLVSLFSAGILDDEEESAIAQNVPWPTSLLNRQIVVNDDTLAPLYFMSSSQVNLQLPSLASTGSARIAIRTADTGELIAGGSVLIAASSPGLFTLSQDGLGQAAAVNQDGRINGASNPVVRGSYISLYGTGQGQVSPAVLDGSPAPSNPLSNTVSVPTSDGTTCVTTQPSMCVAVGTSFGQIQYSGLAPGFVGLWQINVRVPDNTTPGTAVPVRAVINGSPSNTVTIAVQ